MTYPCTLRIKKTRANKERKGEEIIKITAEAKEIAYGVNKFKEVSQKKGNFT